jgi:ABC-2 type transport system ATP-binding protein
MIEIHHLAKRFGALQAVQDLSLQLQPGEILGFLGPNGAGKSTTMKMLTGFLAPDHGEILIHGINVAADPIGAQRLIGYLPEGAPAYEEMPVVNFLKFIAEVRGFSGASRDAAVARAVETMALTSVLPQKIETLSKGYKRRVGLAQAILHDPKVLILDEPTDGLDPNQKHQVRNLIRGLSKDKIVIVSTHILEEVTAVCTRAVIMAGGRLIEDCTPAELERRSAFYSAVTVEFAQSPSEQQVNELTELPGVANTTQQDSRLTLFPVAGAHLFESVHQYCQNEQLEIIDLYQERGRLDDVFRQITEEAAA